MLMGLPLVPIIFGKLLGGETFGTLGLGILLNKVVLGSLYGLKSNPLAFASEQVCDGSSNAAYMH